MLNGTYASVKIGYEIYLKTEQHYTNTNSLCKVMISFFPYSKELFHIFYNVSKLQSITTHQ